jgi:hypothetical protein
MQSYVLRLQWSLIEKQQKLFSLRIRPSNREVRGHCMCKEMPVIPVDRVVDKKRIIGKRRAEEEERHKGSGLCTLP